MKPLHRSALYSKIMVPSQCNDKVCTPVPRMVAYIVHYLALANLRDRLFTLTVSCTEMGNLYLLICLISSIN